MITADEFWPTLEVLGEDEGRKRLVRGVYGQQKPPLVQAWLAKKENARAEAAGLRHETREGTALQLSAEANSIARGSKTVGWVAVVVSVLALLFAIAAVIIEA